MLKSVCVLACTLCARIAFRFNRFEDAKVFGREPVFSCTRDDERLVPAVRNKLRINTCRIVKLRPYEACVRFDVDLALCVPVSEAFRAIESRFVVTAEFKDDTPDHIRLVSRNYHIALARAVGAPLVPAKFVALQLADALPSRGRYPFLKPPC